MPIRSPDAIDRGSVARVRAALLAAGHDDTVTEFPAGTRSAADAAAAIGCDVGQIAKSIVFRAGSHAAILIVSGVVRVDLAKAAAALGCDLAKADATFVRDATGFAIGGVSPIAHTARCLLLLDQSLLGYDPIWAAAGSPRHVFRTTLTQLRQLTDAPVADIAER